MKKSLIGIVMALMLVCTLVLGSVQVLAAGISPYQEILFADEPDDYETEIGNEFHQDVLKFEGNLGGVFDGAWLEYDGFSFGGVGAVAIKVNYCNNSGRCSDDSQLEVWIDGMSTDDGGQKVATVDLPATGGNWDTYVDVEAQLDKAVTGDHDIYMVLVGSTSTDRPFVSNMMSFEFVKGEGDEPTETPAPSEEATATPEATEEATAAPEATEKVTEEPTETPTPTTAAPKATTPAASATQGSTDDVQDSDPTLMIVIVVVAVVVIVAAVAAIVIIKKKKG